MITILKHYGSYNARRYSTPWVCRMTGLGEYDFKTRVGDYSGRKGEDGDLVVFAPADQTVYGFGQKDYRGGNTEINFVLWNGAAFVPCDRFGQLKEAE